MKANLFNFQSFNLPGNKSTDYSKLFLKSDFRQHLIHVCLEATTTSEFNEAYPN